MITRLVAWIAKLFGKAAAISTLSEARFTYQVMVKQEAGDTEATGYVTVLLVSKSRSKVVVVWDQLGSSVITAVLPAHDSPQMAILQNLYQFA